MKMCSVPMRLSWFIQPGVFGRMLFSVAFTWGGGSEVISDNQTDIFSFCLDQTESVALSIAGVVKGQPASTRYSL